jgi:hypothetical protein
VDAAITETLPEKPLPTHTWDPSGVTAADSGRLPTWIVLVTRPVATEITVTEPARGSRDLATR